MIRYHTEWYNTTWHYTIWYDMIWFDVMIWYDTMWHPAMQYEMIWYDTIRYEWFDVICFGMIWYMDWDGMGKLQFFGGPKADASSGRGEVLWRAPTQDVPRKFLIPKGCLNDLKLGSSWNFYGDFMGFYGDFLGFLWWFPGILWWFHGIY